MVELVAQCYWKKVQILFECLALVLAHGNSVQSFCWTYLDPVRYRAGLPGTLPGRYEAFLELS